MRTKLTRTGKGLALVLEKPHRELRLKQAVQRAHDQFGGVFRKLRNE
jgi:hypothetical protein